MSDAQPFVPGKAKRPKIDKRGRFSTLENVKKLKGCKGESRYVTDGRESSDDDSDDENVREARKRKIAGPRTNNKDDVKKKGNIRNALTCMSSRKNADTGIDDDDDGGDNNLRGLMSEVTKNETLTKPEQRSVKTKFSIMPGSKEIHGRNTRIQGAVRETRAQQQPQGSDDSDEITVVFDGTKGRNKQTKTVISISPLRSKGMNSAVQRAVQETRAQGAQQSDDSDEITVVFDGTRERNKQRKSVDKSENIDLDRGTRRDIVDDEITSKPTYGMPSVTLTGCDKVGSSSRVVENVGEDLSQFFEEFSNPHFECANTSINETQERTIGTQNNENTIFDAQLEMQKPNVDMSGKNVELSLPLTTNFDKEEVFRFYWWDAYEDPYKQPGVVYLFGKVFVPSMKQYRSCCVTVQNIPRRVYLLPRLHVKKTSSKDDDAESTLTTMEDVYKDFNEFANKSRMKEIRCRTVTKSYVFEQEGTPEKTEYLEVRYSANYPRVPSEYTSPAIGRVFGTTTNALELLLLEQRIKGPCWLDVKCPLPTGMKTSWCNIKVNCTKMENISVYSEAQRVPPLITATLNIRICLNPMSHQNEVVMIAILVHQEYQVDKGSPPEPPLQEHFCLLTHPRNIQWPRQARDALSNIGYTKVKKFESETDLLEELLEIIHTADPDVLIGYDCDYQFDILMHRMLTLKVPNWSRIGRLKRSTPPIIKGKIMLGQVLAGRPICDIQVSAKDFNLKVKSYDLQSLCVAVLKKQDECREIKPRECSSFYSEFSQMENLIRITLTEASSIFSIAFDLDVIPLALQITCIAGNIISRTLTAGRAERNEYLLLHAFHVKDYITPDKRVSKKEKNADGSGNNSRKKKPGYAGGLVLDPKKGFYDTLILLMDFNSLYPSIIQEYNLCFTTVPGAAYANVDDLTYPESDLEAGVVPSEIRKLVESRVQIKKLMKAPNLSPELKTQYNIRQMALKLTANSIYGCLGATHCRFYAKGLAALITAKGREILRRTKSLVEEMNYEVIYGDTDSIMINTNIFNYEQVLSIGEKIKQRVNESYKQVELDIDGVFRYLLLLQKKKYAAVTMTKLPNGQMDMVQEHKGLDIVRRDWCQLACDVGKKVLNQLFSDHSPENRLEEICNILRNVGKNARENRVPLSSLVITKQLSKDPKKYPNAKEAHVRIALRLNKEGGRMWKVGDAVPYIICEGGTGNWATEKAYHIDEYKKSDTLKIDVTYYLLHQVLPTVLRICEPIDGIDEVLLAENLGLGGTYKSKAVYNDASSHVSMFRSKDRFQYCHPLVFHCKDEKCRTENTIDSVVIDTPTGLKLSLAECANPDCKVPPWTYVDAIKVSMTLAVRNTVSEDCKMWLECDNPLYGEKTRKLPMHPRRTDPRSRKCAQADLHWTNSEIMTYDQMCYYRQLFDTSHPSHKQLLSQHPQGMAAAYDRLKEEVESMLSKNVYSVVSLYTVFARINSQREVSLDSLDEEAEYTDESEMTVLNCKYNS